MSSTPFHEGYYIRAEGSNYTNYSWLPETTIPMAAAIKRLMDIKDGSTLLDVGAARGYLVKALKVIGINARGYDISDWAVEHCDPSVKGLISTTYDPAPMSVDYIVAKDVFEHVNPEDLVKLLGDLVSMMRVAMLIIVPLAGEDGGKYLCPKDELDTTHVNRWTLPTWLTFLERIDRRLVVSGGYYVNGIKQANTAWEKSCGFITIRRV